MHLNGGIYVHFFKRLIDILISLTGIVCLFPLFLVVMVILFLVNNGNPFFFQARPGKNGKIFKLVKFKTMNDKTDGDGNLLPDTIRQTKIGRFLRKTSLDEIPQLLNVIKGEMSVVGPRPLLVEYLPLYSAFQERRHEVCPGITGWAQVNGRNTISWQQKFEYDVWYVDHISFSLDVEIIWKTIFKVCKSENINLSDNVTMEKFRG